MEQKFYEIKIYWFVYVILILKICESKEMSNRTMEKCNSVVKKSIEKFVIFHREFYSKNQCTYQKSKKN